MSLRKYTLSDLLGNYSVRIPVIQRDYVQGNTDPRATQIREQFSAALCAALQPDTQPLHLDFIYGTTDGREVLTLLDGQQRVTTLFLLHWYLAVRAGRLPELAPLLAKFSYATRISSRKFTTQLLQEQEINKEQAVSAQLSDRSWYRDSWRKDPTVAGMLVMLDALQSRFSPNSQAEISDCLKRLLSGQRITFHFLNMSRFELTDELYIKMNSRGKPLTDFENLKAWMIDHIRGNGLQITPGDWEYRMDGSWMDLFWKNRARGIFQVDAQLLQFFNGLSLNQYVASIQDKPDDRAGKVISDFREGRFIPMSTYEEVDAFTEVSLNRAFALIGQLSDKGNDRICQLLESLFDPERSLFRNFIRYEIMGTELQTATYPQRVLFQALHLFLEQAQAHPQVFSPAQETALFRWMRVAKNLINNRVIDTQELFVNAVKALQALKEDTAASYELLQDHPEKISFFSAHQIEEESLKARLILQEPQQDWETAFVAAESHSYFRGQVHFLLNYAKEGDGYDLAKFQHYAAHAGELFGELLDHPEFLVQRALLTQGSYLIQVNSNQSFCLNGRTLTDREANWRRVFRDSHKAAGLKALIDSLPEAGETALRQLIAVHQGEDWLDLCIREPELIRYCNSRQVRVSGEEIIMLRKTNMNGTHAELYSYYLSFHRFLTPADRFPFTHKFYYEVATKNEKPCCCLDHFYYQGGDYALDIRYRYRDKTYRAEFFDRRKEPKSFPEELLTALKAGGCTIEQRDIHLESPQIEAIEALVAQLALQAKAHAVSTVANEININGTITQTQTAE